MINLIKRFIAKDEKGRWFIDVIDKIETTRILEEQEEKFCPPHRMPHTIPFIGEKVADEPCHIHTTALRYYTHHLPYCLLIGCPNAKAMMSAREKYFKEKGENQ